MIMEERYIRIGNPYIYEMGNQIRIESVVLFPSGEEKTFFFTYPIEYSKYISYEVLDSFLLSILPYCLINGFGIKSDYPASDYLLWNLKEVLIPTLVRNIGSYNWIDVNVPASNIIFNGFAGGTGFSCGVDSFYSVLKNLHTHNDTSLNVSYLCFFNAGAAGTGEKSFAKYQERAAHFKSVSQELGCNFITGETNINDLYPNSIHEATHVYRTLGMVLNLQKLFKVYYFSSGFPLEEFGFDCNFPAKHDILSMQTLSTLSTKFILCGGETDRIGKLKFISSNEIVRKNLNVCIPCAFNCGRCAKCIRTMLELYLINEVDNFSQSFDVAYFKSHFRYYVREALISKNGNDMKPIIMGLKKKKDIHFFDYIFAFIIKHRFTRKCYNLYTSIKNKILKMFKGK